MVKARAAWLLIFLAGLSLFGWLSIQVYRSRIDPEGFRAGDTTFAWILGPNPDTLREAAERRAESALDRLNDRSLPPAERLARYRDELRKAEKLLVRSLRAQPAQARALAQLAAVRWELDPPLDEEAVETHLRMIALASSMAPTAPGIQMQLGELLLKMGRRDEALGYLARTVELNPRFTAEVVGLMRDHLFAAGEILGSLPPGPDLLADLGRPFLEDGDATRYLEAVEALLADDPDRSTVDLLSSYGTVCLELDRADRLREWMEDIGALEFPEPEAARWYQLARASLRLNDPERAIEEARGATRSLPESPMQAEILGDVALRAGDAGLALDAYRRALALAARRATLPRSRARYYTKMGRAEEKLGRPDRAYDEYKRALRLDPGQEHARKRVEEMESAAGLPAPSP